MRCVVLIKLADNVNAVQVNPCPATEGGATGDVAETQTNATHSDLLPGVHVCVSAYELAFVVLNSVPRNVALGDGMYYSLGGIVTFVMSRFSNASFTRCRYSRFRAMICS